MAIPFIASNEFLNPATAIDLTSSPQLVLTNNSTFTNADNLTTIEGEEVSGSGYARINLSVLSNSVQPGGDYKLIYDLAQITPSGGSIAFDRVVLISGSNWVGYWQYGTTTIANGQTYPFRGMTIQRTDQGTLVNGQNGLPAWTTTSASFTHPASVGQSVSVTVGQTSFMAVGSYVYFDDGVSRTQYKITAIGSGTNATLERTTDEVVGGTTMQSGGKLVPSGKNGEDGVDGINSFGLAYTYSSTLTAPPSSGQVRLNNATLSSVTAIYASETDRNSVNISTILNGLNPGSILQLVDESTPTAWAIYQLNTLVDSGSYSTIGVTHIGSTGTFSGGVRLMFANKGNTGAAPPVSGGSIIDYDPLVLNVGTSLNAGEIGADGSLNGGTGDPITQFSAHFLEKDNIDIDLVWSAVSPGDVLILRGKTSETIAYYSITKLVRDSGDSKYLVSVDFIGANGEFTDGEPIAVQFVTAHPLYTALSASDTLSAISSNKYFVNCSGGNVTLTLPLASTATNKVEHLIKRIDSSSNSLTLARSGSDLIDGVTSQTLSSLEAIHLRSDGVSNWWVF
jgi:hypothetical protein